MLRPLQALSEDVVALPALERQAQRIPIKSTGRLDVSDDRRNTGDELDIRRICTSVRGQPVLSVLTSPDGSEADLAAKSPDARGHRHTVLHRVISEASRPSGQLRELVNGRSP